MYILPTTAKQGLYLRQPYGLPHDLPGMNFYVSGFTEFPFPLVRRNQDSRKRGPIQHRAPWESEMKAGQILLTRTAARSMG